MRIELPKYHWFVSKHEGYFISNTYSGSLGTIPDGGCTSTRTFNYRVYADISNGTEREFQLVAESYIIQPWHLGCCKTDFEHAEFICSEIGLKEAIEWLSQMAAKYGF